MDELSAHTAPGLFEEPDDVQVIGDPSQFVLLFQVSSRSQCWRRSVRAMQTPFGCVLCVTHYRGSSVAESLLFVPGARIVDDQNGGKKLET